MSKSTKTPPRVTKTAILRKLLSRKAGADLAALQTATAHVDALAGRRQRAVDGE